MYIIRTRAFTVAEVFDKYLEIFPGFQDAKTKAKSKRLSLYVCYPPTPIGASIQITLQI